MLLECMLGFKSYLNLSVDGEVMCYYCHLVLLSSVFLFSMCFLYI